MKGNTKKMLSGMVICVIFLFWVLRKSPDGFGGLRWIYELLFMLFWGIIVYTFINNKDMVLGGFTLKPSEKEVRLLIVTLASALILLILY